MFAAAVLLGLLWISGEHDRLARDGAREMVTAKVASFEQNQRDMTADNSIWTEAYQALARGDTGWLYDNVGTAAMIGTVDLVAFVPRAGAPQLGWLAETPPEGATGLVPPEVVDGLLARLRASDPASQAVVSAFARFGGDFWLLTATRVIHTDGVPEGVPDSELPRQIRGVRAGNLAAEIRHEFPLADVHIGDGALARSAETDSLALPLVGTGGTARLVWTPPTPGTNILRRSALPLAGVMIAFFLFALLLSRYATGAARRLETALVAARAADRAKTDFLGVVSHELRTPMNGILGLGQILETDDLAPRQRQLVGTIITCARSQMRMIEALLDATQIDAGKREMRLQPVDLSEIVRQVADVARLDSDEKRLALLVEDSSAGELVLADEEAIRRVVVNLVDNAVKFTKRGGVTIRVSSSSRGAGRDSLDYRISVSDTGIGIDPSDHERIFQRLTQLDGSPTRAVDGLGLGLPICRSLVDLLGGEITLESARGEGSTFTVSLTLPLVAARPKLEAA